MVAKEDWYPGWEENHEKKYIIEVLSSSNKWIVEHKVKKKLTMSNILNKKTKNA